MAIDCWRRRRSTCIRRSERIVSSHMRLLTRIRICINSWLLARYRPIDKLRSPSLKYGAHLARWTHANNCIINASTKGDDDIRYQNIKEKTYLAYFKGHTKRYMLSKIHHALLALPRIFSLTTHRYVSYPQSHNPGNVANRWYFLVRCSWWYRPPVGFAQ